VYGLEPWDLMPPPPGGPRLVDLRVRSCLTQQQVADRLKIGPTSYSLIETGRVPLNQAEARMLAAMWRVPVADVVEASKRDVGARVAAQPPSEQAEAEQAGP